MKTKFFFFLLALIGLSTMSFAQYDYVSQEGGDVYLTAANYGTDIIIDVPNGGEITMHSPTGSTGHQWVGEGDGLESTLTTCGAGNYALATNQGSISN